MSQPIRWSVSVDEETVRLEKRWREKFSPMTKSRSSVVVLLFKLWDEVATDPKVIPLLAALQGLKVNKSEYELPAPTLSVEGRAKPPVRSTFGEGTHRGRVSGVSRRSCLASVVAVAYGTSFPLHSTRFIGRAA